MCAHTMMMNVRPSLEFYFILCIYVCATDSCVSSLVWFCLLKICIFPVVCFFILFYFGNSSLLLSLFDW